MQNSYDSLCLQIRELKSKLHEENTESNVSVKEEVIPTESDNKTAEQIVKPTGSEHVMKDLNYESLSNGNGVAGPTSVFTDFKDGSSDSDSSAILNEDNNNGGSPNNAAISSGGGSNLLQSHHHHQFMVSQPSSSSSSSMLKFGCGSSVNCFQFSDSQKAYQPQFVKIEEHNFFSGDDACNFFSDEPAPTLHWYYADQWS